MYKSGLDVYVDRRRGGGSRRLWRIVLFGGYTKKAKVESGSWTVGRGARFLSKLGGTPVAGRKG